MEDVYKLTYFNAKGLAEPIRLIFAYAGVAYEDIRLEKDQWPTKKADYPFGQVPVLTVGDKTLSQSTSIARFLAKRFNLCGKDEWEAAKIDEYVDALRDLRTECKKMTTETDEKKKAEVKKNVVDVILPKYLSDFESQIKADEGPYMVGTQISWLDISLSHWLMVANGMVPGILASYPNLQKLIDTVFEYPKIKAWISKRPVTEN